MYEAKFAGGGTTRAAEALGDRNADGAPTKQRRPDRVVESLVRSALTGARAMTNDKPPRWRSATRSASRGGVKRRPRRSRRCACWSRRPPRTGSPARARDSIARCRCCCSAGYEREWRAGGDAELAEVLAPAVVELAWLQLDRPIGQSLSVEEALVRSARATSRPRGHALRGTRGRGEIRGEGRTPPARRGLPEFESCRTRTAICSCAYPRWAARKDRRCRFASFRCTSRLISSNG